MEVTDDAEGAEQNSHAECGCMHIGCKVFSKNRIVWLYKYVISANPDSGSTYLLTKNLFLLLLIRTRTNKHQKIWLQECNSNSELFLRPISAFLITHTIIVSDLCSSDAKISSIIVLCVKFVSLIEKVRYIKKMLGSARAGNPWSKIYQCVIFIIFEW